MIDIGIGIIIIIIILFIIVIIKKVDLYVQEKVKKVVALRGRFGGMQHNFVSES